MPRLTTAEFARLDTSTQSVSMLNIYRVACAIVGLTSDAITHWKIQLLRDALCDSLSLVWCKEESDNCFVPDADEYGCFCANLPRSRGPRLRCKTERHPSVVQEGAADGLCRHLRAPRKHGIQAPLQRLCPETLLVVFVSVRARKGIIPFLSSVSCSQNVWWPCRMTCFKISIAKHLEGAAHVCEVVFVCREVFLTCAAS